MLISSAVGALVVLRRFFKMANDPRKHSPNIRKRILKLSMLVPFEQIELIREIHDRRTFKHRSLRHSDKIDFVFRACPR